VKYVIHLFTSGAQIIDLMLLIVDITKGIQTQTAECLVIGEITCDKMIVVLNKIDLIDPAKRASTIDRVSNFCCLSTLASIEIYFLRKVHFDQNSLGDEIANVNFSAVCPEGTRIR